LAVAGFTSEELTLTAERNLLTIEGKRAASGPEAKQRELLHRGIGTRAFKQTFQLADHVKVNSASLSDGLLTVDLAREIPEVMRPRQIQIGGKTAESQPNQVDSHAA
jgi:molecular chaperone IbpA